MSIINVTDVQILDNPAAFTHPFKFQISFESSQDLQEDLEWKVTYVGSAESEQHDQVLDSILVGPVQKGKSVFVFQTPCPDATKIPPEDLLGVTAVMLTCSYKDQEFIRVGYFVNNEYTLPELMKAPPNPPLLDKIQRSILESKPRITRFQIDW